MNFTLIKLLYICTYPLQEVEQGGSPIKTVLGSLAIAGDPLNIGGVRSLDFEDQRLQGTFFVKIEMTRIKNRDIEIIFPKCKKTRSEKRYFREKSNSARKKLEAQKPSKIEDVPFR